MQAVTCSLDTIDASHLGPQYQLISIKVLPDMIWDEITCKLAETIYLHLH